MTLRLRNRIAAWLALGSIALNALWPLLANARPNDPASPSEICSASGLNHAPGEVPTDSRSKNFHCSLCPFHAERGLAIANVGQPLIPSVSPVALVFARNDAPRPKIALHPAAPPRAPPFLS
jgi:DUF2946 family protein